MRELWSGIKSLDKLRNRAAFSPTGVTEVSIEELNAIRDEIIDAFIKAEEAEPVSLDASEDGRDAWPEIGGKYGQR